MSRHLFFDDRASVPWVGSLAEALTLAAQNGKRVFVQIGSRDCGGSRALVEKVIPKEEIAEELGAGYVCVCADVGALSPELAALAAAAPKREPTPLCLYLSAEGKLVHSTVGGRPAAVFLRDLTEGLARGR